MVAVVVLEEDRMRVTSNGKVWRSEAEWRTICERFARSGLGPQVTDQPTQRPGAYVVLKSVRPVVKLKETQTVYCPPAPPAVLEKGLAA
jgi:hypothetical protein